MTRHWAALSGMWRASSRPRRCTSATSASARSRSPTTTSGSPPRVSRERIASGPGPSGVTATCCRWTTPPRSTWGPASPPCTGPTGWPPSSGLGELWIKDDTANPTGSFKDRVVSVALTKARQLGFKVAACASTGNLANSVAAHAARAGMASVVLIPQDLEAAKVTMTAVYGGIVVAVKGSYDDVNRLCAELTSEHPCWAFVNVNVRTYYAEGSKTLAFEVAEQLGWRAPDHVVVPIASGSQLTKVAKGFAELAKVGLIERAAGAGVGRPGRGVLAGGDGVRRGRPTPSGRSSRTPSPSRFRSGTRPTGGTRCEAMRARAARARR